MKILYVTLNTADEARRISHELLEKQLAVCTNWFPITCAYRWEGKITEEPETVLVIKTQAGYRNDPCPGRTGGSLADFLPEA